MFDFRKLNVSELRAISGDLGLKQNKSATQSELATKVADYFHAKGVVSVMASLDRPKLQNVARKLSISPRTGTNREIAQRVVDAVLAGNVSFKDSVKPEPKPKSPKNTDPKPGEKDPNKENRKGSASWVVPVLVAAGIILIAWLLVRSRPAAPADNLTPLQTSIDKVSKKLDNLGQDITGLSDRVTSLEKKPAPEAPAPVEKPNVGELEGGEAVAEKPMVGAEAETEAENLVGKANFNKGFDFHNLASLRLNLPSEFKINSGVLMEGDIDNAVIPIERDYLGGLFVWRAVFDDIPLEFNFHRLDGSIVNLLDYLDMKTMDAEYFNGLSAEELSALEYRGIDVVAGEILAQNAKSVNLGPVYAGEYFTVVYQDNPDLGYNVGVFMVLGDAGDQYTVKIN
ncbi:hypothetical protein K0B04_03620 [Patescibacteria group bacterium]|nr:hypothetical protein [Patescibacteria group bacterium]